MRIPPIATQATTFPARPAATKKESQSRVPDEYIPSPGRSAGRVLSAAALGLATSAVGLAAVGPAAMFVGGVVGAIATPLLMLANGEPFDGGLAGGLVLGALIGAGSGLAGSLGPIGIAAATSLITGAHLYLGHTYDQMSLKSAKFWDSSVKRSTTPDEKRRSEGFRDAELEYLGLPQDLSQEGP